MDNKIHKIFSTPIYKVKVPKKFISLINSLNKEEMGMDDLDPNDPLVKKFGLQSKNTYILHSKVYKNFKKFITDQINDYGYNILGFDSKNWVVTQSWVNQKNSNEKHHLHNHTNSIISGVFFYGKKDKNTPSLNFFNPFSIQGMETINSYSFQPDIREDVPDNTTYFSQIHKVPYIPGTMVLFPSYLPHNVATNDTNTTRKSLAFNSLPKVMGYYHGLNEIMFADYDNIEF